MIVFDADSKRLPSRTTFTSPRSFDLTVSILFGFAPAARRERLNSKEAKRVKIVFIHFVLIRFKIESGI